MSLFAKPEIDVERHIELRMRRVFPVSWEAGLHQRYQEALKEYQAQQEFLKEFFDLQARANVLGNRVDIFSWLKRNLTTIEEAVEKGEYTVTRDLLRELRALVESEESKSQKELESVISTAKSKGIEISISSVPSPPPQPTQQPVVKEKPETYIVPTSGNKYYYYPSTGTLVDPQRGLAYSTAYPEKMVVQLEKPVTQPSTVFGGQKTYVFGSNVNPFQLR